MVLQTTISFQMEKVKFDGRSEEKISIMKNACYGDKR